MIWSTLISFITSSNRKSQEIVMEITYDLQCSLFQAENIFPDNDLKFHRTKSQKTSNHQMLLSALNQKHLFKKKTEYN